MVNWFRVVSREKVRGRGESLSVSDMCVTRRHDPRGEDRQYRSLVLILKQHCPKAPKAPNAAPFRTHVHVASLAVPNISINYSLGMSAVFA